MVDLALLQSVSYIAGALGVCVAAIYYIINMRFNMKAREMEICRSFASDYVSEQGMERYGTVMSMEWKDYEDFMKKYGYSNPEMFKKWTSQFFAFEMWGILIKSKIIRADLIYDLGTYGAIKAWEKFRPIIIGRRGISWGQDYMVNAEYLAKECLNIKIRHDEEFKNQLEAYRRNGNL
jgi:hypothetical protein